MRLRRTLKLRKCDKIRYIRGINLTLPRCARTLVDRVKMTSTRRFCPRQYDERGCRSTLDGQGLVDRCSIRLAAIVKLAFEVIPLDPTRPEDLERRLAWVHPDQAKGAKPLASP
jgi:hypothetical protein